MTGCSDSYSASFPNPLPICPTSGASLLGYELARMIFCDSEPLVSGVPSPLSLLGKGLGGPRSLAGEKVRDIIEHEKPVVPAKPNSDAKPAPPTVPSAPAAPNAATKAEAAAKEASDILTEQSRRHLFEGEINKKRGNATGWHYESTGDREKGTYVIEGTRSPPDAHGVYEGNVMIEGMKKGYRSTFFPRDWTKEQVETAVREAYESRRPEVRSGTFRGETSTGMKVELRLDGQGKPESAYPIYQGPKYPGPKK